MLLLLLLWLFVYFCNAPFLCSTYIYAPPVERVRSVGSRECTALECSHLVQAGRPRSPRSGPPARRGSERVSTWSRPMHTRAALHRGGERLVSAVIGSCSSVTLPRRSIIVALQPPVIVELAAPPEAFPPSRTLHGLLCAEVRLPVAQDLAALPVTGTLAHLRM